MIIWTNGIRRLVSIGLALSIFAPGAVVAAPTDDEAVRRRMVDLVDEREQPVEPWTGFPMLKPQCDGDYPMHARTPCGTATGGPSGGLH